MTYPEILLTKSAVEEKDKSNLLWQLLISLLLIESIREAGKRRLNAIMMTSLTSIVCMAPLLFSNDMDPELEKPLAIATIGGMVIGTIINVFVVPLAYWAIYRKQERKELRKN